MKTILALSILFSVIALPALGELTDADLDKIHLIVNEEIEAGQIDAKIQASEDRTQKHVTQQIESLKTPVAWLIGIHPCRTDRTHRRAISCLDNPDRLQLTRKNQSRTPRRNRNAEATADCTTLT